MAGESDTFLYFAYASNLFSARMLLRSPSAVKKTNAVLKDHELVFSGYSEAWKGAKATIIKKDGHQVWGVVWELPMKEKSTLDREEPGYSSILVEVEALNKECLTCSVYKKKPEHTHNEEAPSLFYKQVILKGAKENDLPNEYIERLQGIPDNGYNGPISLNITL